MKLKSKILIIDDEPINLEFFEIMLARLGFEVEKAEDGIQGLKKVEECTPDLIILDNIMPNMSGWDFTRAIKNDNKYKKYKNTPIIMFSAMNEVKDKIEGLEMGVDDYITKPFNFSEVLARIRAVLRNRELMKQVSRRERRISVIESLNKSLIYFTQHIKKPINDLLKQATDTDVTKTQEVNKLLKLVEKESGEILATLNGLEDEIKDLQNEGDELKRGDLTLEDLEEKFQENLKKWKEKHKKLEEVTN